MTINELGKILKEMYLNASDGYMVANIHLFGIKYAEEIITNHYKASEIIKISGIKKSYATELIKGIKLSEFVSLKK